MLKKDLLKPLAEVLILLLQIAGFVLMLAGFWCIYKPFGLLFAGACAFYFGHRLWQELDAEKEYDGR